LAAVIRRNRSPGKFGTAENDDNQQLTLRAIIAKNEEKLHDLSLGSSR
jgi:hypothetical protein